MHLEHHSQLAGWILQCASKVHRILTLLVRVGLCPRGRVRVQVRRACLHACALTLKGMTPCIFYCLAVVGLSRAALKPTRASLSLGAQR